MFNERPDNVSVVISKALRLLNITACMRVMEQLHRFNMQIGYNLEQTVLVVNTNNKNWIPTMYSHLHPREVIPYVDKVITGHRIYFWEHKYTLNKAPVLAVYSKMKEQI